jgi:flagellar basal-body rod protein FlgF
MDNANYVALSRQSGLMKELSSIANNMANANTIGFKREGAVFSEYVSAAATGNPAEPRHSLSMGRLAAHASDFAQGGLRQTGGILDVAIDGPGFFLVDVNGQTEMTRAGHFLTDAEGRLITTDGHSVLNEAEGEIQIPLEAGRIAIGSDGVLSADGVELGRLGVVNAPPETLVRRGGNNWTTTGQFETVLNSKVSQGFLEDSNVQTVTEIARMIEVQRHYEAGQKILDMEDSRIRQVVSTIRQLA